MVLSIDRWISKVAIVTGASSGCGASISEFLVESGIQVVGLARRLENLQDLSKKLEKKRGRFHPFKADVTNEKDILKAFEWTKDNLGPIHILINSAGLSHETSLIDGDTEMWRKVLETNVLGLCVATREAVRQMRANNIDGQIIHINSVLGHHIYNIPNLNVYPASKFSVTALTETLRQELLTVGSKIKISAVSPGPIDTDFLHSGDNEVLKDLKKLKTDDVTDAVQYILSTPADTQVHDIELRPVGVLV